MSVSAPGPRGRAMREKRRNSSLCQLGIYDRSITKGRISVIPIPGPVIFNVVKVLSGLRLAFDQRGCVAIDGDAARLFLLRDHALKGDMQQAVFQFGLPDLDMIGELEAAFEGAAGDALMQIALLFLVFALARDGVSDVAGKREDQIG